MQFLSAHSSLPSPARGELNRLHRSRFRRPRATLATTLVAFALAATACGGGTIDVADVASTTTNDSNEPTVAAVEPTAEPIAEPTVTPEPPAEEEGTIQDVAAATVKVLTEGTFVPPLEVGQRTGLGIGTGFIIDEAGIMVTNNHVVTGGAIIEVFLDGATEPLNARLLGVSECSDLAVLDIEGDGYEFLEFRTDMGDITPGLPIFAAGYPANLDTDFSVVDYTLTAGIVSTVQASGASTWSSVDSVIEHDARIRGGNSGGPLVDEQGRVVGINYAGEDVNDLNFAIAAIDALPTIEALKSGDVESLGINGQAIVLEGESGVWVSAVAAGSPADRAGLKAGDLIISMQGLELATDGTMEDYCDIIRTNGPDDTLSIEVVRIGTEEVLEGQINGTPLVQSFSFAEELSSDVGNDQAAPVDGGYTKFVFVADNTDSVGVEVPVEWVDLNGEPNTDFGESIYASPDIQAFTDTWDVPGIIVERTTSATSANIDEVLDIWSDFDCAERSGREDFATDDGAFAGRWEIYTQCGGTETAILTLAVSPPDGNSVVRMFIQIVSDADLAAADRALATFAAVS